MRIAVMQPYFLPYIGYWQLMAAVDRFVIYDDVQYIHGGWVNRNRLLINGAATYATVPVTASGQACPIHAAQIAPVPRWRDKLLHTLSTTYRRSPGYREAMPVLEAAVTFPQERLAPFVEHSMRCIAQALRIGTELVPSLGRYSNEGLKGSHRVLDICRREGASEYLNLPGGVALYDDAAFDGAGIRLHFIRPHAVAYSQRAPQFVPWLSIADLMMSIGLDSTRAMLARCDLMSSAQLRAWAPD